MQFGLSSLTVSWFFFLPFARLYWRRCLISFMSRSILQGTIWLVILKEHCIRNAAVWYYLKESYLEGFFWWVCSGGLSFPLALSCSFFRWRATRPSSLSDKRQPCVSASLALSCFSAYPIAFAFATALELLQRVSHVLCSSPFLPHGQGKMPRPRSEKGKDVWKGWGLQ